MAAATGRPCRDENDLDSIRRLLVETHPIVAPGWNWDIRRWDGWRFHREHPLAATELAARVALWETPDGRLVGAVHPGDTDEAVLELDPNHRDLESEMVMWAEGHLAARRADGLTGLSGPVLWVDDDDAIRRRLLQARGYRQDPGGAWLRLLHLADVRPHVLMTPPSVRIRTTEPTDPDCARMADLLNNAFGRSIHTAREYRTFIERSPSFDHALNLVAVARDGTFAAHVGLTYDEADRHGIVEPVCTDPRYRRLGLSRGLLREGLQRLAARGAETVQVDSGEDPAASALYVDCGFTEAHHLHRWRRALETGA